MLTKKQARVLRTLIEDYAEAYEDAVNAGRLMPEEAEQCRSACGAAREKLDAFILGVTQC